MLLVADALLLTIFLVCAHMHAVCPGTSLHCPTLTFPTPTVPIARPPPAPCQPASPHNLGSEYGCGQHDCLLRTDSAALCPASITHSPHHRSGSPSPFLPPLSPPLSLFCARLRSLSLPLHLHLLFATACCLPPVASERASKQRSTAPPSHRPFPSFSPEHFIVITTPPSLPQC